MLRYENKKTGSLLNIPDEQKISDMDDWSQMIKLMIWNDNRLMKEKMTQLATVLNNIVVRSGYNDK